MNKKFVLGGAAAAVVLVGTASAAQLTGVDSTTLAAGQVTVTGAGLESVDYSHWFVGGTKVPALEKLTLDLDVPAGKTVSVRLLQKSTNEPLGYVKDVNGKTLGYSVLPGAQTTDEAGRVTFDFSANQIPLANIDAMNVVVGD